MKRYHFRVGDAGREFGDVCRMVEASDGVFVRWGDVLEMKERLKTAELLLEDCSNFDTMATYDNGVGAFGANEGACMAVKHYDRVNTYLRNRSEV